MRARVLVLVVLISVAAGGPLAAQPRPSFDAHRAVEPPTIDGYLGESEWGEPLAAGEWLSYNPLHGDRVPQRTAVWISYDADALYFAFRCDDPEPPRIKTSITRRDNIWQDDWIGLSLDALGTGQQSYHMLVNRAACSSTCSTARRAARTRRPTGSGTAPGASPRAVMSWKSACRCRASASAAAQTRGWASSSGDASAGWASRWHGHRSRQACGCSSGSPRCASAICSLGRPVSCCRASPTAAPRRATSRGAGPPPTKAISASAASSA